MSPIATFLLAFGVMLLAAAAFAPALRRPRGGCADAGPACAACALSQPGVARD